MNRILGEPILTAILVALTTSGAAAGQPAALRLSPAIRRGVDAFPRLVAKGSDEAAARINRALKKADDDAVEGMCNDYRRQVWVTMRGPRYLSLFASADWFCGGAHPDYSETALVYDLATGTPAAWKRILPGALVETAGTAPGGSASDPVAVTSAKLWSLYAKRALQGNDKACADVFADAKNLGTSLMIWPDAETDGLRVQAGDWPHVVRACARPITLGVPMLRKLGVQAAFIDAIDEAHRLGWYDKMPK